MAIGVDQQGRALKVRNYDAEDLDQPLDMQRAKRARSYFSN
jgi:hypothetical protein